MTFFYFVSRSSYRKEPQIYVLGINVSGILLRRERGITLGLLSSRHFLPKIQTGSEARYSPSSNAEFKNEESHISIHRMSSLHRALIKLRDIIIVPLFNVTSAYFSPFSLFVTKMYKTYKISIYNRVICWTDRPANQKKPLNTLQFGRLQY
jgi:hypothetical protein